MLPESSLHFTYYKLRYIFMLFIRVIVVAMKGLIPIVTINWMLDFKKPIIFLSYTNDVSISHNRDSYMENVTSI